MTPWQYRKSHRRGGHGEGTLNVTNSDIVNNVANGANGGGAFYTNTWNTITVTNSILWDNWAPNAGRANNSTMDG